MEKSSAAVKAPIVAPIFTKKSMLSHGQVFFSGRDTPPTHRFGSVHTYRVSWGEGDSEHVSVCNGMKYILSKVFRVRADSSSFAGNRLVKHTPVVLPCRLPLSGGSLWMCTEDTPLSSPTGSGRYSHHTSPPDTDYNRETYCYYNVLI